MSKIKSHFYMVETSKIDKVRIVLLSDIHYNNKEDSGKLEAVLKKVKELVPDYICIAGDMLDQAFVENKEILCDWIKELGKITQTFISLGNHDLLVKEDFEAGFDTALFDKMNSLPGVKILKNEESSIGNICFKGLALPASYYYQDYELEKPFIEQFNRIFSKTDENKFHILLCHSSLVISKHQVLDKLEIADKLDLILCGHTHGGITPEFLKPFLQGRGLVSPLRMLFFKNAYGQVRYKHTNIIISSGITKLGLRNRFHKFDSFFTREITVIDVKNINKK